MSEAWWKSTTIYQIYPRSFADSNNDGVGDIPGIISKLDYIQDLGFETIWLSPHYIGPQKDFGYDIADFRSVAPEYGTMQDAENLISKVHERGMKIIFDMILNHTSDQHPWFLESKSSKDNPKRDWYIWRDGKGNRPPNNWKAIPGGSGWEYDKDTKQWYFHNFLSFQPDLNYRNPEVKEEMLNTLRFWLDKGIDGFRLDIFHSIFKDQHFRDNPFSWRFAPTADQKEGYLQKLQYNLNRPEAFEFAKDVRRVLDEYDNEPFAVGEVFGEGVVKKYLGKNNDGLSLILLFDLIHLNQVTADSLYRIIEKNEKEYPPPLMPTFCLGNHDRRRYFSRINKDEELAKVLALFIYTTRCVPINYYGDELGIPDGDFPFKNALDALAKPYWWVPKNLAKSLDLYINRDGCRTPMQWDDSPNSGFTKGTPWLPISKNFQSQNVNSQSKDPLSLLNTHKDLLRIRNNNLCLKQGKLTLSSKNEHEPGILCYERIIDSEQGNESLKIVINISSQDKVIQLNSPAVEQLFSTDSNATLKGNTLYLPANSGAILN